MRTMLRIVALALLMVVNVSIKAAAPDERLVGLWRGPVEAEEWVFMFATDASVRGLIGHRTFGVRLVDDSFHYSIQRYGSVNRLIVTKVAGSPNGQSMSFTYRFPGPNSLELVPFDSSEQAGSENTRPRILLQRTPQPEEIQITSEAAILKRNGLMWQISTSERQISWKEAQAYCQTLRVGGFTNWRLPRQGELASILDIANFSAALAAGKPPILEPLTRPNSGYMLSGTPVQEHNDAPWVMNLINGHIFNGQGYVAYARCVRSAQLAPAP